MSPRSASSLPDFRASLYTYTPGQAMPLHAHPEASLSVVLRGRLAEEAEHMEVVASALSVVFKPAGTVHADVFGPEGASMLSFALAPGFLEAVDEGSAGLDAWQWHHAGPLTPATVRLVRVALSPADGGRADAEDALVEVLSALGETVRPNDAPPGWLRLVQERLDDAPEEAPTVAALAEEAGVHRVHLARQFRRYVGCSVSAYRRRAQVRAAADRLASSDVSLPAAALDAGFADQSHCCRVFRAGTGLSPGAFRALIRSVAA